MQGNKVSPCPGLWGDGFAYEAFKPLCLEHYSCFARELSPGLGERFRPLCRRCWRSKPTGRPRDGDRKEFG
jgi:hypothetical protein